jgi:hypothetical protein
LIPLEKYSVHPPAVRQLHQSEFNFNPADVGFFV